MGNNPAWRRGTGVVLLTLVSPLLNASNLDAELGGYIAGGVDHYGAFYDEDGVGDNTEAILRSAKLELELAWGDAWEAEFDGSYSIVDDKREWDWGDLYVQYDGPHRWYVRAGQFKEPFGFERLASYTNLNTSERSLVTSAFAPGRSAGLMAGQDRKAATWSLGAFTEKWNDEPTQAVTGRVTVAPVRTDIQALHIGVAASWRDLKGERFQIKDKGEIPSADNIIRSPRFDATDTWLAGLEAAWLYGPLTVTSEIMAQQVKSVEGDWWRFSGAYLQASVFLTGDRRRYDRGGFDRIAPNHGYGAVELVVRQSAVDLRDRGVGAEASVTLLGVAYHLGERFQLRADYLLPDISGNTLMADPSGDAASLRLIARF